MSETATAYAPSPLGRRALLTAMAGTAVAVAVGPRLAHALSAQSLDIEADAALRTLYSTSAKARQLGAKSRAMLIFPKIRKAGFVLGGQGGEGVLRIGGKTNGYYRIRAASFGFQAGVQSFSYVMFLVTQTALDHLRTSKGWAMGSGPNVVIVDQGAAAALNTSTLGGDAYGMVYGQKGLMAGIDLGGSKISQFTPG